MAKLTLKQVNVALKKYVRYRWKTVPFANHLQISIPAATKILRGDAWVVAIRPDGFEYPWSTAMSTQVKVDKEMLTQQLHQYFEKPFSAAELGRRLKISRQAANKILKGKSHQDIVRLARSTTRYLGTELLDIDYDDEDEEEVEEVETRLDS